MARNFRKERACRSECEIDNGEAHPHRDARTYMLCHPERSEANAERSRRTPCLSAPLAAPTSISAQGLYAEVSQGPDALTKIFATTDDRRLEPEDYLSHSAEVWSCTIFQPSGNFRNTSVNNPCGVVPSDIVKCHAPLTN